MDDQKALKVNSKPIDDIVYRYRASHMLNTAVEKGIFTRLAIPKKAHQLADEIHSDSRTTEKFLNVLVASGLLIKSEDKYQITPEAKTFLDEGQLHYIGNLVRITVGSNVFLNHLGEILTNGGSLQGEFNFDRIQLLGHAEGALCCENDLVINSIKNMPEFATAKKMLDLGGGHGVYSMALAENNNGAEVVMFDQPHVIEFAREYTAKYGMADRIQFVSGDFNEDDIGTGYDLVFVSHVFYQRSNLNSILRMIYESLNKGGIVVLNHWMVDECRTSPRISVIFDLYISLISRDNGCYTVSEFTDLLRDTGFENIRIFDIRTQHSPSMIVVGKK